MIKPRWRNLFALALLPAAGFGAWWQLRAIRSSREETPTSRPGPALRMYVLPFTPNWIYPSPLGDGHTWLANNYSVQAFNPATGTFQDMKDRFGDFVHGMRDRVASDPFEPDKVWVGSFRQGLLCYRKSQGRGQLAASDAQLGHGGVEALLPDASCVWIANRQGLYRLSRSDGKVEPLMSPRGPVEELRRDQRLGVCFRIGTSWWAIQDGRTTREIAAPPMSAEHLKAILYQSHPEPPLRADQVGQVAEDGHAIWFVNHRGLGRMDRKTGSYGYLKLQCGRVNQFDANSVFWVDRHCLWVRCGDRLFAVDKQPPADLLQSEADVRRSESEPREEASDILSMVRSAAKALADHDARHANASPKQKEDGTWGMLRGMDRWLRAHPDASLAPLQALSKQKSDGGIPRALQLYVLMCGHALKGDAESALWAHTQLEKTEGKDRFHVVLTPEDVQSMRAAAEALKRIQTTEMPPDQRLWELATAYSTLESTSWNQVEVGFDQTRSRKYLQRLLKQHPASPFADKAWWELHRLENRWGNEGYYDPRGLSQIESAYLDFLKRYPDSDKVPLAHFLLACMVHSANEPDDLKTFPPDLRRAWLLKARTWCLEAVKAEQGGYAIRSPTIDLKPSTLLPLLEADLLRFPAPGTGPQPPPSIGKSHRP